MLDLGLVLCGLVYITAQVFQDVRVVISVWVA